MSSNVWQTPVLVTDFDGTMTANDFYQIACKELVPPGTPDYWASYLSGALTHFEALQRIFTYITADEVTVMAAARHMELDPQTLSALRTLREAGWEIVVASAGCDWYIRRLLGDAEPLVELHANPGELIPGKELRMDAPTASPFYTPATGIDKVAITRRAVETHAIVAFAGDGRPDLPAALLVPPERCFARGWLAEHLTAEGIPFQGFERWSEIAWMLLEK